MADSSPSADLLSTNLPEMPDAGAPGEDGAADENSFKSRLKQKKLLVVLGVTALGGVLLGVAVMTVIAYLQPAPKIPQELPVIIAPPPDPKLETLAEELKQLKAQNEKLEERLKLPPPVPPAHDAVALPAPVMAPAPVPAPRPVIYPSRSAGAKPQEKVTADCTVPDKDAKLGDKLKSCIEGFNADTN